MFIPITVGQGIVETVFTPRLSGDFTADCQMIVSGVLYEAGEVAAVRRGTEIKLRGETLEDKEFTVTLDGVEYTWYVKKPTVLQAVENGGFYKLVGEYTELNVGDKILTLQEGPGNDDLVIPDYGNELILSVDIETGNYRAVAVTGLEDMAISPRQQYASSPVIVCALASRGEEGHTVILFDTSLNELSRYEGSERTWNHTNAIVSSQKGFLYSTRDYPIELSFSGNVSRSHTSGAGARRHISAGAASMHLDVSSTSPTVRISSVDDTNMQAAYEGSQFTISHVTQTSLFVADYFNSKAVIIDRTSGHMFEAEPSSSIGVMHVKSTYIGDHGAISSVLIEEDGSVLVGFFDEGVKRFRDGEFESKVSEAGTSFMVRGDGEIVYTRLHDTDIVYNVTQSVTTLDHVEVKRNTARTITFQYEAEVGGPATLVNELGTVRVNGQPFNGMLPASCSIEFTMPGTPGYYDFRKMGIVGASAYEWDVVSEPQLLINNVTLPPRYDAQIRTYEYESIEVGGITEGYFEEVYTTSPNVQIQVNGGEWSDRALITTKDTVTVRWYLERYGAKYDPNIEILLTRNNEVFATWYVLKMGLDGVEVQKEHGEPFRVADTWQESDNTVEASRRVGINVGVAETDVVPQPCAFDYEGPKYVDFTGHVKHEPRSALIDLNALPGSSAWFGTIITESEFNPTANTLTVKALTGALQPVNVHLVGTAGYAGVRTVHAEVIGTMAEANGSTERSIVSLGYDALVSPKTYMYEHSAEARAGSANVVAYHGYGSQVKAAFKPTFQRMTMMPDAIERYAYIQRDINGKAADVVAFQNWAARTAHDQSKFDAAPEVAPPHDIVDALPLFGVHPSPMEKLGLSIVYGVEIPKLNYSRDFATSPIMAQPPIFRTFNTSASTVKYRIVEFKAQVGATTLSGRYEFSIEPVRTLPTVTRVFDIEPTVGKAAEVVYGPDRLSDVAVGTSIKEIRAVVEFRATNFRDVEVEDGLFTREQADEELELYSGGSIPVVVPAGDSFIVRTLQIEDDAECLPEDVLTVNRKAYGYLGGG